MLDSRTAALVLIDLQRGIVGRPLAPHSAAQVLERSAALAAAFRAAGAAVAYVGVDLRDMADRQTDRATRDPNAAPPPPEASEVVPESGYQPGVDLLITKRQWGAFCDTGLDQQLRRRRVRTVVLGGVATNFGVESTARAAADLGYEVVFAEDAMTTMSAEMHEFAVRQVFPFIGRVWTTGQILDEMGER